MPNQLFAVERYDTERYDTERYDTKGSDDRRYEIGDSRSVSLPELPLPGSSRLITLIRLANDDVMLALVEGPDSDTVAASMTAAGWRVDRISPASWLLPPIQLVSGPHRDPAPEVLK